MKKTFTLLFALGLFAAAQAQPGTRDNRQPDQRNSQPAVERNFDNGRDVVVNHNPFDNDDRFGNNKFSNERKMKMEIAQVNREFDYKIQRVKNSFFLSRWEKQRQIRFLENQRDQEIRMVYAKFKNKNRYDEHDYPNRRHY